MMLAAFALGAQGLFAKAPALFGFLLLQAFHYPSDKKIQALWEKMSK